MGRTVVRYLAGLTGVVVVAGLPVVPARAAPDPGIPVPPTRVSAASGTPRPLQAAATEARIARQNALMPAAQELARHGLSADSGIGGVRLDLDAGVIHVYRTPTGRAPALTGLAGASNVVTHPAKYNRHALNRAVDTVTKEADDLVASGVTVQAVAPNTDGSGITVSVQADPADLAKVTTALRSRFGGVVSTVVRVDAARAEQKQFFGGQRFNDGAPWRGGDRTLTTARDCTTGFPAELNSAPVLLTVTHCGGVGTWFYNGPNVSGGYTTIGQGVMANGDTQVAAIGVSSVSPFINAGPAESPYTLLVLNWWTPIAGGTVCQSGSASGEVCDLMVISTGVKWCTKRNLFGKCKRWAGPYADVIHLAGPGNPAAAGGDSGAPVYAMGAPSAGVGGAVGLVEGSMTPIGASIYPDWTPTDLLCLIPEGWQFVCTAGFAMTHMPGY